ncbi:hypothetical protein ACFE04_018222 [Oxalis oulophora]
MASNKNTIFFAFVALLLVCFVKSEGDQVQVRKMCEKTRNTNLCVGVIQPDSRSELKTNYTGLVKIVTNAALTNATNVITYIKDRMSHEKNETTSRGLDMCLHDYEIDVIDGFTNGLDLLNDTRYQDLKTNEAYEMLQRQIGEGAMTALNCVEGPFLRLDDPLRNATKMVWTIGMIASDFISLGHCNKSNCFTRNNY